MIKLSASLIKDILSCTQRGYYRINYPEQSIETAEMTLGTVVHKTIEQYWNDEEKAIQYARSYGLKREIDPDDSVKLTENFFKYFKNLCSPGDEIERPFDFPLWDDVYLVGKLDRVDVNMGTVVDWKTTKRPPVSLTTDPQFIIYDYAFKRLYGKEPSLVAYASLTTGKIIPYKEDPFYTNFLFQDVIPRVVNTIKSGHYSRDGMFGLWDAKHDMSYSCYYCSFRDFCWGSEEE